MSRKSTKTQGPTTEPNAMEDFQMARNYHAAAEVLFSAPIAFEPRYFLYFHTVELALKAFLRSHNHPVPRRHELTKLYEECRKLGLVVIGPADRFGIGNIVSMLEFGNQCQGFRYYNPQPVAVPELSWTREVVGQLMQAIEPHVEAWSKLGTTSKRRRLGAIYGRPKPREIKSEIR
jgi:hypothetical protein